MTPRNREDRPLVAGGQGRTQGEILLGALVVAFCAAGILVIALSRALGIL